MPGVKMVISIDWSIDSERLSIALTVASPMLRFGTLIIRFRAPSSLGFAINRR